MGQVVVLLDDELAIIGRERNRKRLAVTQNQPFLDTFSPGTVNVPDAHGFVPTAGHEQFIAA